MATVIELQAREQTGAANTHALRRGKKIPGVVYGDQIPTRHFAIEESKINQLLQHGHGSKLLDVHLAGEDKPVKVIVQHTQQHPVSGSYQHVDLYQVRADRELHTEIPMEFTGIAPAVKNLGGTFMRQADHLPIICLPDKLIDSIEVPIGVLATFEDLIRVKDLQLPEGVRTELDLQQIVASVAQPRTEEELAKLNEEVTEDVASVEVTAEKKEEDEAGEDAAGEAGEAKKKDTEKE